MFQRWDLRGEGSGLGRVWCGVVAQRVGCFYLFDGFKRCRMNLLCGLNSSDQVAF